MPYLTNDDRERLNYDPMPKASGDMNYLINLALYDSLKDWHKSKVIQLGKDSNVKFPVKEIVDILNNFINDKQLRYQRVNDCVGACVCAVFEFIRRNPCNMPWILLDKIGKVTYDFIASWYERNAADYEDEKIKQNGDVFPIKK